MKALLLLILIASILGFNTHAQPRTADSKLPFKQEVIPLLCIGTGSLMLLSSIDQQIQENITKTDTRIDDYTQWAPAGIMFAADALGGNATNIPSTQFAYFGMSTLTNTIIVHGLKRLIGRTRPYGGVHSFPSGHTSQAFVAARTLWHEYKDSNRWVASSGYLFATATGILRMTNNRHWFTDVLVGAGIGMLVTDLIYAWDPLKNWKGFKVGKSSLIPSLGQQEGYYTAGLNIQL